MDLPAKVFLIDDDEDDGFFFITALNSFTPSIELIYYQDSETALNHLITKKVPVPDIIFLDWNMPKISGRQFLQSIRVLPHLLAIPVIVCSTAANENVKGEALRLGATQFFSKPTSISVLTTKLQNIFYTV